jgi:hypothetical protein
MRSYKLYHIDGVFFVATTIVIAIFVEKKSACDKLH